MDFYIDFSTKCKLAILQKFSLLYLDSTYNTHYAMDDPQRKEFLLKISFKRDIAGHGVPVAFMLNSSEY